MEPETITISIGEYRRLVEDSMHISMLQARGVDNWENYVSIPSIDDFETIDEWRAACLKAGESF